MEKKAKILLIEDQAHTRKLIMLSLSKDDFLFLEARNGYEALEKLGELSSEELPDIIIMERSMLGMSGAECISIIRKNEDWSHLPVIFLTADAEVDNLVDALEKLGADGYIVKPFRGKELQARIRVLLRMKKAEDQIRTYSKQLEGQVTFLDKLAKDSMNESAFLGALLQFSKHPVRSLSIECDEILKFMANVLKIEGGFVHWLDNGTPPQLFGGLNDGADLDACRAAYDSGQRLFEKNHLYMATMDILTILIKNRDQLGEAFADQVCHFILMAGFRVKLSLKE